MVEAAVETGQSTPMTDEKQTPAHARPALRHWALVAAGCGAVIAGALAVSPAQGSTTANGAAGPVVRPVPDADAPDPAKAELPLDCGPFPVKVALRASASFDGRAVTVAAAHCAADNGTPPDGAYLLGAGPDGRPVVQATLVRPEEGLTLAEMRLRSDGTITGRAKGYSSTDVPHCCPDLTVSLTWTPQHGQWTRTETKTPLTGI
ncbi:hypothetical protein GCM10009760_34360 [Kitasatospora kazusensis]|uniref:Serine protease n=1 Tax=Kitasatospora kazusensis TaxID=407974 RepID=A0ABP5LJG8_9ACTN